MKTFKQFLNAKTPSMQQLAAKHKVPLAKIKQQIQKGANVEKEHSNSVAIAKEIARDHINELPDYYKRLAKIEKAK